MTDSAGKHVFVSYVREDSPEVDALCAVLEAARIPYWRDRTSLGPGDAWKAKIRDAIQSGSLVFIACFSDNSRAKDKSHMNEELTLAVEEYRKMSPGRTWLIPVRFDSGDLPEWDLGAGRVLSDLNYVDLYGPGYAAAAASLVTTVHGVMGERRLSPSAALEAVEQATAADRTDLLKRLTKEMLLDPQRRIELDDLVSQEVQRVMAELTDDGRVSGPLQGQPEEQVVQIAHEARELWQLSQPFCASLQVAGRWAAPDAIAPWGRGIRAFVGSTTRTVGGIGALLELRHLPGMVAIMTATLACASSGNWESLKTLVVDETVRDKYERKPVAVLEATDFYKAFSGTNDWVTNALALATIEDRDLADALKDFSELKQGKYHTPVSEWLHHALRPIFVDQWPDDTAYSEEFDRAEVMLGVLAQDVVNCDPDERTWGRSHWYGRSTWRSAHGHGNPVDDFMHQLETQGPQWAPLKAGLFGGDQGRARVALDAYRTMFDAAKWRQ